MTEAVRNAKEVEQVKEMLVGVVKCLVDNPDFIVRLNTSENSMILELEVAGEDVGKIIGKEGRMAHALRTIVGASGAKLGKRTILEIIE